ncbi:MAG: hypothetical protein HKN47_23140, partial [Pirellulaceae bacterium]|nr:hypothetical protein [Pirellulaceae bacterium]
VPPGLADTSQSPPSAQPDKPSPVPTATSKATFVPKPAKPVATPAKPAKLVAKPAKRAKLVAKCTSDPGPVVGLENIDSGNPTAPTTPPPGPFSFDSGSKETEEGSDRPSKRRVKKRTSSTALAWWMVGGSVVLVLFAVGGFFYVQNHKAKRVSEIGPATTQTVPSRSPEVTNSTDQSSAVAADQLGAASAAEEMEIGPAPVQAIESPTSPMNSVTSDPVMNLPVAGDQQSAGESAALQAPAGFAQMEVNTDAGSRPIAEVAAVSPDALGLSAPTPTDVPADPLPKPANALARLVRQYSDSPFDDVIHKDILSLDANRAWADMEQEPAVMRAKYVLLRLRYHLADKDSVEPLQQVHFGDLVAAAKSTFWGTTISNSDPLVFHGAESIEGDKLINALVIVGTSSDAPPERVEMIRQQVVVFKDQSDAAQLYLVNQGRHVYSDQLQRKDSRSVVQSTVSFAESPSLVVTDAQRDEWSANGFRFPVWALDIASDEIQKHFGMTPPDMKSWPIERFTIDGKLIATEQDPQNRVLGN